MSEDLPVAQVLEYLKIPWRQDGPQAWLLCPLHEESTPSCHIHLRTGRWYCFGCGRGGDLLSLVAEIVGDEISALATIRRSRDLRGVEVDLARADPDHALPAESPESIWRRQGLVDWLEVSLDDPLASYLIQKRGFRRSTLEAFDVRRSTVDGYPVALAVRERERIVGVCRRRLDNLDTGDQRKYRYNYGFDNASTIAYYEVRDVPCLLVEGVLDLMKAAQHGHPRVAALLGWRLTDGKIARLRQLGVSRVVCALDNTPLGEEGWRSVQAYFPDSVRFEYPSETKKDVGDLSESEFHYGLPR